jgi:hypothetical protein
MNIRFWSVNYSRIITEQRLWGKQGFMKTTPAFILFFIANLSFASTKGEVKILYPCESLNQIPHEKEVKGTVTFLETKEGTLYKNGIILRKRQDAKESDTTIKMRWTDSKPSIDSALETQLSQSVNGELKCELDMNYDPTNPRGVESCSFKSDGLEFFREHTDFLKMVKSKITEIPSALNDITLTTTSWKIPVTGFKKKPELEMWVNKKGQCLLEASAKFDLNNGKETLTALKNAIQAAPSAQQISKTGWALGINLKRSSK